MGQGGTVSTPQTIGSDAGTRMASFHIAGEVSDELAAKLPRPLELME